MKILMTGGTGFVGNSLTQGLAAQGYQVTVLTRSVPQDHSLPQGSSFLQGNPTQKGAWQERVPEHEIIINLAGASIFTRWGNKTKRLIRNSRILTTHNLVEALSRRKGRETLFISTSAVGYYGFHGDEELDESGLPGNDFLASVTREWEATALAAESFGARVLLCRLGIVLGTGGGALGMMLPLFRWYLGSPLGSGTQWFSWIHQQDLVKLYIFLIQQKDMSGPVNCTAPHPLRNREMTEILGEVLKRPTFLPSVPSFVLKLFLGEFGSMLLKGQKVLPCKLLDKGFQFEFPDLRSALKDLLIGEVPVC
jgi:uncharacterized protein (TIGR01777 family)